MNYTKITPVALHKDIQRDKIEADTQAFLAKHAITEIPNGVTGIVEKKGKRGLIIHFKSQDKSNLILGDK